VTKSYIEAKERGAQLCGVGLGLRWDFLEEVLESCATDVVFWEVSPENYMGRGGFFPEALEKLSDHYDFVTHGLTMSVGAVDSPAPSYMQALASETKRMSTPWHSDHLCLSTAGPLVLHDLLPLPLTKRCARRVANRIKSIEDELALPFCIENISFYAQPVQPEMSECDFLCEVLHLSGAGLLLDVNNVFVNGMNHHYDPLQFIQSLPHEQVVQLHMAGHSQLTPPHPAAGMLLDTHGSAIANSVKTLFKETLQLVGAVPVVLERDNNIPDLHELLLEVHQLQDIYDQTIRSRK